MDGDRVELSNLHRQILHRSNSVGQLKVFSAIESLRQYVHIDSTSLVHLMMETQSQGQLPRPSVAFESIHRPRYHGAI